MTPRERWIVYPLLFLALGAALRDKLVPPDVLRCQRLEVVDASGEPRIALGGVEQSSQIELKSPTGETVLIVGPEPPNSNRYGVFAVLPGVDHPVPLTLYYRADQHNDANGAAK